MPTYTRRTPMPVPPDALFAWHARPGAFQRLTPPWQSIELTRFEGIEDGQRAVIKVGPGPLKLTWIAEHRAYEPGRQFKDVQIKGPWAHWEHTHRILPADGGTRSVLEDHVAYRLPLGPVVRRLGLGRAHEALGRIFAYRHRVTRTDLNRHAAAGLRPLTVAVTGPAGLLGRSLCAFLTTGGHTVVRLVRSREAVLHAPHNAQERAGYWNPERGEVDPVPLEGVDAVVHLAGESVYALRWSAEKQQRILQSRADGTRLLSETLARLPHPPKVLLSASGAGYYGDRGDAELTEAAGPGDGFLPDVCQAWEQATEPAEAAGIRVVHLRLGVVLSPDGGFLKLALPAFRLGLGGRVGSGEQFVPWLTLDDFLYAILHLLADDGTQGPANLAAPEPVRLAALVDELGAVLRRPAWLRVPAALARAVAGQLAEETALASARMVPERLVNSGFRFAYSDLHTALRHLLGASTSVSASA